MPPLELLSKYLKEYESDRNVLSEGTVKALKKVLLETTTKFTNHTPREIELGIRASELFGEAMRANLSVFVEDNYGEKIPLGNIFQECEKNLCVVPLDNPNRHNYKIGKPTIQLYRKKFVNLETTGNDMPEQLRHFRGATEEEIDTAIKELVGSDYLKSVLDNAKITTDDSSPAMSRFLTKLNRIRGGMVELFLGRTKAFAEKAGYGEDGPEEVELSDKASKARQFLNENRDLSSEMRRALATIMSIALEEEVVLDKRAGPGTDDFFTSESMLVIKGAFLKCTNSRTNAHSYREGHVYFYPGIIRGDNDYLYGRDGYGNHTYLERNTWLPATVEEISMFLTLEPEQDKSKFVETLAFLSKVYSSLDSADAPK